MPKYTLPAGLTIADLQARQTASDWHGGLSSPLYALASSGAIVDGVETEILEDIERVRPGPQSKALRKLYKYVIDKGRRGPVPRWSDLHW